MFLREIKVKERKIGEDAGTTIPVVDTTQPAV